MIIDEKVVRQCQHLIAALNKEEQLFYNFINLIWLVGRLKKLLIFLAKMVYTNIFINYEKIKVNFFKNNNAFSKMNKLLLTPVLIFYFFSLIFYFFNCLFIYKYYTMFNSFLFLDKTVFFFFLSLIFFLSSVGFHMLLGMENMYRDYIKPNEVIMNLLYKSQIYVKSCLYLFSVTLFIVLGIAVSFFILNNFSFYGLSLTLHSFSIENLFSIISNPAIIIYFIKLKLDEWYSYLFYIIGPIVFDLFFLLILKELPSLFELTEHQVEKQNQAEN